MRREEKAWLLATIVIVGTSIAVWFHYRLGYYRQLGYPFNTFLFRPDDALADFRHIFESVKTGNPYSSVLAVYFPFTYMPLFALRWLSTRAAYAVMLVVFTWLLAARVRGSIDVRPETARSAATFILTVMTYPFLFCVDRGNLEILVFIFMSGFFMSLRRGHGTLAASLLAGAAAMKGYPALFGLILIARRQWKDFAVMCGAVIGLTLMSAAVLPGGITGSLHSLQANLLVFRHDYLDPQGISHFNPSGMQHNLSYFGLARVLGFLGLIPDPMVGAFEHVYVALAAVAGLFVAAWVGFVEKTLWRQTTLITVAVLVLPQVSFDYKLILLMFPITQYLASEECSRLDRTFVTLFGLLLIPKSYAWIVEDISLAVAVTPLLLTALAIHVVTEGFSRRRIAAG